MKRLSILLDDIAMIRNVIGLSEPDPVQVAVLAEAAGVQGLACTFRGGTNTGITERDLKLLKDIRKSFLNLYIPAQDEPIHQAMSLSPDMVTFIHEGTGQKGRIQPVSPENELERVEQMLPDFRANRISVAIRIEPEINLMKSLSRMPIDYVELDVSTFTAAADINEEIVALDHIKSSAMAAAKLGFGVNCGGGIRYEHIPQLGRIPQLEDVILGRQFLQRAFLVGVDRAVNEALQLLRQHKLEV
ncbi:MAG: pyridoxine 5'-phosphate synthase [Calditrichia bacterium]